MAYRKQDEFSKSDIEFASYAKALSHPARVAILRLLSTHESLSCGEIVKMLRMAQPTVSQHLKELRLVGLIRYEIIPPRVIYTLNVKKSQRAEKLWLKNFASE
ncbi:MAG: metalloregulator ArsR/SmtB family transcription factor [Prevotellaceae bacterium]|jgi:DNA-binding transcriptional ArsR family regulator|nr:metalloregulator ArsR/SmtB family transcription factor [Prevotellaceae bacterium]